MLTALGYNSEDIPVYYYEGSSVDTPCGNVTAPALYCSAQGGPSTSARTPSTAPVGWTSASRTSPATSTATTFRRRRASSRPSTGSASGTSRAGGSSCRPPAWGTRRWPTTGRIRSGRHCSRTSRCTCGRPSKTASTDPRLARLLGIRGLYSVDLGNCNTWTAAAADVD
ncbi:hypothetical protein G7085_03895 [Tessaracoccus sp. HDW20]|uniref:hypothetical protein n=1 Tax=Tessaracoccus coleopterorum TaxID=2714950 RepID=UPI0018D3E4E1|nr:hypothetical protein [Tessaracoccus coleopterorum]NHB84076.1 hypothetical protein [Tessaracoccus coleopterorum]